METGTERWLGRGRVAGMGWVLGAGVVITGYSIMMYYITIKDLVYISII